MDFSKFDARWEGQSSPIVRDLKLNFKKIAGESALSAVEAGMVALAGAKATEFPFLIEWAQETLSKEGVDAAHIEEAGQSAAIMGMLNTYYKFRSFMTKAAPEITAENYNQAGLRMTALARPLIGKETFELLALAVSAINGCETCVTSHEKVLRESGVPPAKIHDAARLAAIVKGLSQL